MTARRHAPPPRRWPRSHTLIAAGAALLTALCPVAAWAQSAAPAPAVDVTADRPPHVPPVQRAGPVVVPSIGALPNQPAISREPAGSSVESAGNEPARVTVTARPTGSTGPRTAIATVIVTAPGETTTATATVTATPLGCGPDHWIGGCDGSPPPQPTAPATSTQPEPTPTTPVDVIDQVLDGLTEQETP